MIVEIIERVLEKTPVVNRYYIKKAAKLKRSYCLLLHRFGLLKPHSFVQWLSTYRCNFFCPYCEASAGKALESELTTEEVKCLIRDLSHMGVKRFLISGGEPLVRPDIIELMQYANLKKLDLGLVTNGYRVEDLWDELKQFKYFIYFTSIDGLQEYNDAVRGREKAFEKSMSGLELFGKLGVPTRMINTVVHPGNIDQLESLLNILKNSAANRWHLTPTSLVGRAAKNSKYNLNGEQVKHLVNFIKKNKNVLNIDLGESHTYIGCFLGRPLGKTFFCGAGLTRCAIMPDGEVLGCQQVYDNALSEGNIRDEPFSQIWKHKFSRFRDNTFHEYCKDCEFIDGCQGGCWAEMEKQNACLKSLWETGD